MVGEGDSPKGQQWLLEQDPPFNFIKIIPIIADLVKIKSFFT